MKDRRSALSDWTSEDIALAKRWVETWKVAGADLERIRRRELRELDTYRTISLLCSSVDDDNITHAGRSVSGLVEQQRWFMKAANHE